MTQINKQDHQQIGFLFKVIHSICHWVIFPEMGMLITSLFLTKVLAVGYKPN